MNLRVCNMKEWWKNYGKKCPCVWPLKKFDISSFFVKSQSAILNFLPSSFFSAATEFSIKSSWEVHWIQKSQKDALAGRMYVCITCHLFTDCNNLTWVNVYVMPPRFFEFPGSHFWMMFESNLVYIHNLHIIWLLDWFLI